MWSPPNATMWLSGRAWASIAASVPAMSPEGKAKIADIGDVALGRTSTKLTGWSPSTSMRLAWRIAAGPKRAPGRFEVPRS